MAFHRENGGWLTARGSRRLPFADRARRCDAFGGSTSTPAAPWCQGPALLPGAQHARRASTSRRSGTTAPTTFTGRRGAEARFRRSRGLSTATRGFVDVPLEACSSRDYARRRGEHDRSGPGLARDAARRRSGGAQRRVAAARRRGASASRPSPPRDTSYVCVVDRLGQHRSRRRPATSPTSSPVIPGTGLVPSSRGSQSWADPSIQPASRPASGRGSRRARPCAWRPASRAAVRHAGRRRAGAGDAAGAAQHHRVRHGSAGRGELRASPPTASPTVSSRTTISPAGSAWNRASRARPATNWRRAATASPGGRNASGVPARSAPSTPIFSRAS